ncbi:zinc-binding alcohol dehydrogenase family protein [Allorhizobium sp. BGMRC 0089]|uniref:quinone oxidoreductase family protein n=1 Tax=Allorhizobium sonneratiae TaxID=2934936 RepID=UPI0020343C2B|nr:zinc-binding alcohol dehydrogenase family protein [Allorhizobium sonneratiae]MCM2291509.1 zinc-binding alcohol dehydrogenase family protein [Allorhizobium sonneratiae]
MKAAIVAKAGHGPVYSEFAEPVAGPGETIITVMAAALSPLVRSRAAGKHYSMAANFPFVVGVDGVGRLEDGRRVYFLLPRAPFGAMAERTVVPDGQWVTLPDDLDDTMAAVIANPGMSSWAALKERADLRAGETVLINGATGSAGMLAIRIARHLGAAKVIVTGRNETVLRQLEADDIVPLHGSEDEIEAALRPHFANGVDVVLDYLWGPSARAILIAGAKAAPEGVPIRFVQIGSISGSEISLPAAVLRSSSIAMKGSGLGSVSLPRLVATIDSLFKAATSAGLSLDHRAVPLSNVAASWQDDGQRIVYLPD